MVRTSSLFGIAHTENGLSYAPVLTFATDEEASELERIREACLPEVLLAYIAILNSSAQYISRELLLASLDMGALVASKDSDLANCFVSIGRMPELVDILAFTSTNMLLAGELGGSKKRASTKLSLWSAKGSSQ